MLVFGSGIKAVVNNATVLRNAAGSPLAVTTNATLDINQVSNLGFNQAVWGGAALVMDSGTVTVTGSSVLYNNSALHSGGGINCVGGGKVVVGWGAVLRDNTARFFGGGMHGAETCRLTVTGGAKITHNNSTYGDLVGKPEQHMPCHLHHPDMSDRLPL